MLGHREFAYVGEPVPELKGQEGEAFLMNIQMSILLSLEKRDLLTALQRERCLQELEKMSGSNAETCSALTKPYRSGCRQKQEKELMQ